MPLLGTRGAASARGFGFGAAASRPTVIGQAFQGGYYAGQISTAGNGVADYYLVVSPLSSGQTSAQWKTANTSTAGTSSVIDGPTNSNNMNNIDHPAAQFCKGLSIGGYTDWYMPAKNELDICYYNLKPTTQINNTNAGINANSVPIRSSPYTTGNPAQTSAANFQSTGAQPFSAVLYWSSTEFSATSAWFQNFGNGNQYRTNYKSNSYNVRAVRRVAV
jgi:hypothetical protein